MPKILLLHGPNLNLLGTREPNLYGTVSLADIDNRCKELAKEGGFVLDTFQSNAEHALVDHVQQAPAAGHGYLIINPGAFTHTSIALRDALLAVGLPFIEVHLSNIYAREPFRQHSYLSDKAQGIICGLGSMGYYLAVQAVVSRLTSQKKTPRGK